MNKRNIINYKKATISNIIDILSENNAYVYAFLSNRRNFNLSEIEFYELLRDIDDLNIRGDQIMFAIKKYCKENSQLFQELVFNASPEMIHAINVFSAKKGISHKAVEIGGEEEKELFSEEEMAFYQSQELPTYDNFVQRVEIADCLTQEQMISLMSENNSYVKGMLQYLRINLDGDEFDEIIRDIDNFNIRGNQLEYLFFEFCEGFFYNLDDCLYIPKCSKRMVQAVNIHTAKVDGEYEAILDRNKNNIPFPKLRDKQKEFYSNLDYLTFKTLEKIEALEKRKK